jgi:hypothetical protein
MFTAEPDGKGTKDPDIRQRHFKKFLKLMSKSDNDKVKRYTKNLKSYQKSVDTHNSNMDLLFNNTPSFFRSTSVAELDEYLETGIVGGDKNNYDFVAMSISPDAVAQFGGSILIEYDGDGVREAGAEPATYTAQRQPLQNSAISGEIGKGARREQIGDYMSGELADELEVRMPEHIPLEKLGIKNIYVGRHAIDDMFDETMDKKERQQKFIDKYQSLGKINPVQLIPESELAFTYDDMMTGRTLEEIGKEKQELWDKAKAGDKDALDKLGGFSTWLSGEAIGPHTREYDYVINMPTTTPEINSINATGKWEDPESRLARSRMNDNLLPQEELDKIIF